MSKYFDFKGTIDGTAYFLRTFIGGIGYGLLTSVVTAISIDASIFVSTLGLIPLVWLSLSTINKRLNAIMPDEKPLGWILSLLPFIGYIMSLFLIFKNSKIENHNG